MASKSSVSRSRSPSPRRRSNRIAGRGGRRVDRGQTHFDLTQTSDDSQGHSQNASIQRDATENLESQRNYPSDSERRNVSRRGTSGLTLPKPENPHSVMRMYERLVRNNATEEMKLYWLRQKGYANELRLVQAVQNTEPPSRRSAQGSEVSRSRENALVEKEDDERLYRNFEVRMGIAAVVRNTTGKLFRSKEHKNFYNRLLERGVMHHRIADFDFLDVADVNLREHFERLQMDQFCTDSAVVYPQLTAYFYSNLTFLSPDKMQFSVYDRFYEVSTDVLADIMKVERGPFMPIEVTYETVCKYLTKSVRPTITYPFLTSARTILHKIIISCIRPKASSKTDVSRFEAKLMWAIEKGVLFSLPHTVLLHMYRAISKDKGQLPYGALVTRIFEYHKIDIPGRLCTTELPTMVIDLKMINKMRLKDVAETWRRKEKELAKALTTSKRKGKEMAATEPSSKKRRQLLLHDEDDEEETISEILVKMGQTVHRPTQPEPELPPPTVTEETLPSAAHQTDEHVEMSEPEQVESDKGGSEEGEEIEEEEEIRTNEGAIPDAEEDRNPLGQQGQTEASTQGEPMFQTGEADIPATSSDRADSQKILALLMEIRDRQVAMESSLNSRLETLEKTVHQCLNRIEESATNMEDFTLVRTPTKKSS